MPKRPSIPAEIQREIFIESGHRCAVCGTSLPLERAHIIPWHKSKEHKAEDLICLCANCHERADLEGWGEKALREYKKEPWIMRQYEKAPPPKPKTEVELVINMELAQFDEQKRVLLQLALAKLLEISVDSIRVKSVRRSKSITVNVELPADSALKLLNAYEDNKAEFLSSLAPFDPIRISIPNLRQLKDYLIGPRDMMTRWVSYGALLSAALTFLFGVNFAGIMRKTFLSQHGNQTTIEGTIALLNVALAIFVLIDLRFLRPIKMYWNNSPASKSFRQLLLGWKLLWLSWIIFYGCLAARWLQLVGDITSIYLWRISDALNLINGFFFYYLFFVLDQPSVKTEEEPNRAKSFRLNCAVTFLVGAILFDMAGFIPLFIKPAGGQIALLSNLVPAYIAVGMAFFFGRLDSHYLRLPRVILAPLYLYAIIQLFWDRSTFEDVKNFRPERVAIFSLALILKFVVFLALSKLIRHESFGKYFVVAEKGLRET